MTPKNIIKVLLEYDDEFFLESSDKKLLEKDIKCAIDDSERPRVSRDAPYDNKFTVYLEGVYSFLVYHLTIL